jgi:Cu(I)/Ag(I) efflux system membrane fusion protein/cobalt-zinc-cadmium efflux system membrane fusion protein
MSRGAQVFAMIAFFLIGVALTWVVVANPLGLAFLPAGSADTAVRETDDTAAAGTLYQCPMHPEVIESAPGDCPKCGMALVEIEEESAGGKETIRIDPTQVQNIGVVSTEARIEDVARFSRTVGILDFNADAITWINIKFEGWIEKVHVSYVGQPVKKGQPLFEIYSPELVTTQEEFLRALEYRASLEGSGRPATLRQAEDLVRASLDRLAYWDITEAQIEHLKDEGQAHRRLTVVSPTDGVIAEIMSEALEGMFVKPGMNLYKIADLSTVWVHADVYESDMPWIREGRPAVVTFRNDPGREFRGKVLFLYPEVSRETRTLKICAEVPNPDRGLRPGMYADVVVQGPPVKNAVVVPQSAVIRSGERNIVFVDLGEGRFDPREVATGVKGEGDRVQIIEGVAAGEAVVTQAQFMLDSESRIQEAIAKFRARGTGAADGPPEGETPPAGHAH